MSESSTPQSGVLFPRATSQAGMLACTFGDCREVFDFILILSEYYRIGNAICDS